MITQRSLTIPIFNYRLTVIIFDNWEEVKHKFEGYAEPKGICKIHDGYTLCAINSNKIECAIHESEHIKNAIWEYIGYTPQVGNDEVDAYLITYIYKKIMEVYNKHDK